MRLIRSSFCVFLVFVLLFGLSSTSSYATETETDVILPVEYVDKLPDADVSGLYVLNEEKEEGSSLGGSTYALTPDDQTMLDDGSLYIMQYSYNDSSGSMKSFSMGTTYEKNTTMTHTTNSVATWYGDDLESSINNNSFSLRDYVAFHANGSVVIKKNTNIELTISGFVNYIGINSTRYCSWNPSKITASYVTLQNVDGDLIEVPFENFEVSKIDEKHFSVSVDIPAVDFDVYRISVAWDFPISSYTENVPTNMHNYEWYRFVGFDDMEIAISLSEYDVSVGLLQGIIEWLRSIRDGIVNVGTFIKELPANIWSKISDGLRALFIPTEEAMIQIRDDWDTLMADRFGAIYEAGSLVDEFTDNFTEQTAKDTIAFPEATVNLAGTDFTFGGWDVDLIPDQFEFLVDILKGVLDVICTLAFINAMKNRFSKVLGGDNA